MIELTGYQILDRIYSGTRTLVYRGIRICDETPVVIKVLQSEYPSFSELVQFRNQYTIAKNLNLPGIIQTHSLEAYRNGYALIVEDFGGISLNEWTEKGQTLPSLVEFLLIAIDLCNTLDRLCRDRIIHKDIKPANILINPETKQVKLIDFSIASLLPRETQTLINPNVLEGTLNYISPEQTGRMNRGIDYRTDFYSLGVTFYELLTGRLPFPCNDPMELIHCHIAKQPPSVREINPGIPVVLSSIVSKLMAKNAENRYQSAFGLKADLENCLQQLNQTGEIEDFVIGKRDLCDRFIIPEKLYGRATEVATLLAAFDRVANPLLSRGGAPVPARSVEANLSRSEIMLVAGFSGIGKTVVVNEIHKPIVRQRGYFIKGKYDQFNRNIPFSAFVQAFRDLMGQLLSESDAQIQTWKAKILTAVGDSGQILIDVIPELQRIIGIQPPATELSGSAAQNRFNLLIQKFVQIFSSIEHPLVMFLDDLQWSDSASLKLLQLLMVDTEYLLILGAYRDNEVSPTHPFILTVDEIIKTGSIVNTITLQPLRRVDLNHLIADTMNCELSLAQPLTELVVQKTQGNPFFSTQFLKALYEDGQITFNPPQSPLSKGGSQGGWQCDITQIKDLALTDDVVEFMALQLQKLPAQTQNVLKLGACIGAQFDLQTLAIVSEKSLETAATDLWKALQEGLIIPNTEVYKFFIDSDSVSVSDAAANPTYRFLHDRVQQAAYSLIPDDQKQSTHLAIARLLRQNTPDGELEANIFEIVNHWNNAIVLLIDPLEKTNLAQFNLIAGSKAKASNAYQSALQYCRTGLVLLDDLGGWQNQPSLMLALHEGAASAAYLCGDFAQMEHLVSVILAQNLDTLDRVKTYEIQIQANSIQSQFSEAIAIAQKALEQFKIYLPKKPAPTDIVPAIQEVAELLNGRTAHDLLELPVMTDAVSLASMQLLSSISPASYLSAPLLFPFVILAQVKLSIQSGNTALSAYSYSCYAILLSGVLEDLEAAYEFGQLGLELASKFKVQTVQPRVNFIVGTFIIHCKSHCRNSLPLLTEAFKIGLEVGDFEFTGYSAAYRHQFSYAVSKELTTLLAEIEIYIATLLKLNIVTSSNYSYTVFQTIQRLQATRNEAVLTAQKELHNTLTISNDLTGLHWYWVYRLTASYLLNEMVEAKQDAAEARQTLAAGVGMISTPIFYFYDSLTAFADFSEVKDKMAVLDRVSENQTKLHHRAYHAPMNFQHKYDLVEAEKHRVLGNKADAIEMYDRAIQLAKENQFLNEEALANELAAKFYLDWGKEKVAQAYMIDAYYAYSRWGAKAKVQDLETRYQQLLAPILQKPATQLTAGESISSSLKTLISVHHTVSTSSSTSTISQMLDIATVLKAAQSLYGAIEMDELLSSLMQVVMENAGADKAVLILNKDGNLEIAAQCLADVSCDLQPFSLDNCQDLPVSVIYYVKRTQETIISTADSTAFASDFYLIQQHPQSFLCTPIINQGKSIGILYLENSVTAGAFTADRIELLKLLCSQAAISLENARLYQKSQQALENLQEAQLQLIQSEKMSALGNLVAGIAHEINNPVGFLKGNLKPAMDGIKDLFGLLDIYQQEYPEQTPAIQDEMEAIDLDFLREDLPNLVGSMAEGIDRICNISVSLRTFSRADSDRPLPFNIHEGIDSTILILKHRLKASELRPQIEILKDYGNLPAIECFVGQLNQVFMNFLANAIDALEDSNFGRSYQEIEANPNLIAITTAVSEDKKSVIIRIKDNGIGMSESIKHQIFDHLFTTKAVGKGTGLGLAIARQIVVEKHHGAIEMNSVLGSGTEFAIALPI
ncbi:ATP-binding sensor histidine kinase [Tychonema sp. BBK16]|uniref:trifunctional serine/threonine-protein kinase/ATP-binding protein/sensor histidine kinase n=1 Tax=Tychonema sp. BBK16 TaxID=2699888 RepID=UPI001F30FB3F|nr:ATP-binding sensor histidine kinase [Tychonema sp. BBK16]MCF6374544.1 trifunctional serine/threonine-protein kinase/ATP-binding protein/sensor histidine kinase [Tychonema sp. BBK16]